MSSTMRAVQIRNGKSEHASDLYIGEVPRPTPGKGEVLIRIKAFGINRMDIMQRRGMYPVPPGASDILGVEFSGYVEDPNGTHWTKGQEVFGLARGGAYSEYIVVIEHMVIAKPKDMSFIQAAAVCENYLTAFQALVAISKAEAGQSVLIHAGASGVGLSAIQLARNLNIDPIITTVGSDEKVTFLQKYTSHALNYKKVDFAEQVRTITQGKGVDIILDFVGKDYFQRNVDSLAIDGQLILIGMLSGSMLEGPFNLGPLLYKRARVQGTTLRARSNEYQANLLTSLFESGLLEKCDIIVHAEYSWKNITQAHKDMEDSKNIGKLVCVVD